jgi:hypothetical protein
MQTWVKNLDTGEYVCLDDEEEGVAHHAGLVRWKKASSMQNLH